MPQCHVICTLPVFLMTTLYGDLDSFLCASSVSLATDLMGQKLSFTQQAVWKTGTYY